MIGLVLLGKAVVEPMRGSGDLDKCSIGSSNSCTFELKFLKLITKSRRNYLKGFWVSKRASPEPTPPLG